MITVTTMVKTMVIMVVITMMKLIMKVIIIIIIIMMKVVMAMAILILSRKVRISTITDNDISTCLVFAIANTT